MNLRADSTFVEDEGWHQAAERYSEFLRRHQPTKVLFLELGTGYNTPGIIKYPFWNMTDRWPDARYACINLNEALAPEEISKKSICIEGRYRGSSGTALKNHVRIDSKSCQILLDKSESIH